MGEVVKIGSLGLKRTRKLVKIQRSDIKITKVGPSDIKICQICYQNYPSWCLSDIKRWFLWHQKLIGSDIKSWSDPTSKVELEADHSLLPPSLSRQARPFSSYSACGEKKWFWISFWLSDCLDLGDPELLLVLHHISQYGTKTNMIQIQIWYKYRYKQIQIQTWHKYKYNTNTNEKWNLGDPELLLVFHHIGQYGTPNEDLPKKMMIDDTVLWS